MGKYIDLVLVTVYALAASTLAIFAGLTGAPALVIQAPVVLLLPGYALISAALPVTTLDRLERLTLSLGLSLAVAILGGLVLNVVAGLGARSWSILLTGFIVLVSAVALWRRTRLRVASGLEPEADATITSAGDSRRRRVLQPVSSAPLRAIGLGLALVMVAGAMIFSQQSALQQPYPGFTQLWMLPSQTGTERPSVQIGIVNDELEATNYTLVLKRDDKTIRRITDIALARHETWEETIPIVPGSKQALIEGDLYLSGRGGHVYRSVKVWISPAGGGT